MLVDYGHRKTTVLIASDGEVEFVRSFPIGAGDLTLALADKLGLPFQEAEDFKHLYGFVSSLDNRAITEERKNSAAVLDKALIPWRRELLLCIKAWTSRGKTGPDQKARRIDAIRLCGGGALLGNLCPHLSESLETPVELFRFLNVCFDRTQGEEYEKLRNEALCAGAMGIAAYGWAAASSACSTSAAASSPIRATSNSSKVTCSG